MLTREKTILNWLNYTNDVTTDQPVLMLSNQLHHNIKIPKTTAKLSQQLANKQPADVNRRLTDFRETAGYFLARSCKKLLYEYSIK